MGDNLELTPKIGRGSFFFRAVLGDITMFNGATVGFKLQQLRGGTGGYQ